MQTLANPSGSILRICAPRPSSGNLLLDQAELPALLLRFQGRRVKWEVQLPERSHAPRSYCRERAVAVPFQGMPF